MCDVDALPGTSARRWQRARKTHTCTACRETIRPGDLYHVLTGVWDGEWDSFKHCARCWKMIRALADLTGEAVDLELNCGETYEPVGDDDPLLALAFLTPDEAQVWAETRP